MKTLLLALFVLPGMAMAQPGSLDTTFNHTGKVLVTLTSGGDETAHHVALQSDNKIIVAGNTNGQFCVFRLFPDGSIDSSFGTNGFVITDFANTAAAYCVTVQPDDKVVAAGYVNTPNGHDIAIARYTVSGGIDNSFSTDGKTTLDLFGGTDDANAIALQPDGKIVIGGNTAIDIFNSHAVICRLNADGTLDTTFSSDGVFTASANPNEADDKLNDIIILPSGKILGAGKTLYGGQYYNAMMIQVTAGGDADSGFATNGFYTHYFQTETTAYNRLALQNDGKILAVGNWVQLVFETHTIERFLPNGELDIDYGQGGQQTYLYGEEATGVLIQPDGKMIITGAAQDTPGTIDFHLVRLLPDGTFDPTFGTTNTVANQRHTVTDFLNNTDISLHSLLQPDNKILLAGFAYDSLGNNQFALARYLPGPLTVGLIEFSSNETAPLLYPNPLQQTETLKYTLAEAEQISILLLDSRGKLVTTFVENENQPKGDHEIKLTLPPTLSPGTYFIQIASPKGFFSIKAVK